MAKTKTAKRLRNPTARPLVDDPKVRAKLRRPATAAKKKMDKALRAAVAGVREPLNDIRWMELEYATQEWIRQERKYWEHIAIPDYRKKPAAALPFVDLDA